MSQAEQIRGLTDFLKRDESAGQSAVSGRALDVVRVLREKGRLTPFELGTMLKGVTLRELEDVLNTLGKLELIVRTRDGDEEFVSLSDRGMQVAAPMDRK